MGLIRIEKDIFHSTGSLCDFDLEKYCVLGGTAPVALAAFNLTQEDIENLLGVDYELKNYEFGSKYLEYGMCYFMGYWGNLFFSFTNDNQLQFIEIESDYQAGGYNDTHTDVIIEKIGEMTGVIPKIGRFEGVQYKFITPYIEYHFDSYNTRSIRYGEHDKRRFNFRVYPGEKLLSLSDESWNKKLGLSTALSDY